MSGPRVLFFPAFSAQIGGGHALRCFTLAQVLTMKGATCGVALDPQASQALAPFLPDWLEVVPTGDRMDAARAFGADGVVIDDYDCDAKLEAPMADAGLYVAVIDDLADRPHVCDLLVDPGFGRRESDYRPLVPTAAELLLGPDYALLRGEFAGNSALVLSERLKHSGHRVLISLGLTDVGGHTLRVARLLAGLAPLDVVLGSSSADLDAVRALAGVTLHVDARNMCELIATADVGVGGGGVSTWERACLGLPSISLILAANQADMARRLEADGMVIALDVADPNFDQKLVTAVERLFSDGELRAQLSRKPAHLCDGLGAWRVAEALLARLAA